MFLRTKIKKKLDDSKIDCHEDLNNLNVSCKQLKNTNNSTNENEDKLVIKDLKSDDSSTSSSSCLFTRSMVTFKSTSSETPKKSSNLNSNENSFDRVKIRINHQCIESKVAKTKLNQSQPIESKQKCIHQMHPEILNLSNREDGSCLVCNALTIGRKYEITSSFRKEINEFNMNKTLNEELNKELNKERNKELNKDGEQENSINKEDVKKSNSLLNELSKLSKIGWYWGKLSRFEAEDKLKNEEPGTFLIRDSLDANYILSLSFKIKEGVFHTRIEYKSGRFHFFLHPNKNYETVSNLVDDLILNSQTGIYYYVKSKKTGKEIRFTIKLDKPMSRFKKVNSLKYLAKFAIKQHILYELIHELPVPDLIKSYLKENHF